MAEHNPRSEKCPGKECNCSRHPEDCCGSTGGPGGLASIWPFNPAFKRKAKRNRGIEDNPAPLVAPKQKERVKRVIRTGVA